MWSVSSNKDEFEEKRRHQRLSSRNLVRIWSNPSLGIDETVLNVQDLSEGGMGIRLPNEIKNHSALQISVCLPQKNRVVTTKANVRWVQWLGGKDGYEVGVSFKNMNQDDRTVIREFVGN